MSMQYKCVAAPERAPKRKGAKTRTERVAACVEDVIAEQAVDGWEYVRTDLFPVEESGGWFSRRQEVHRAVMVFARDPSRRRGELRFAPAEPVQQPVMQPPVAQPMPQQAAQPAAAQPMAPPEMAPPQPAPMAAEPLAPRAPAGPGAFASTGRQTHRSEPFVPLGEDYPTDLSDARLAPPGEVRQAPSQAAEAPLMPPEPTAESSAKTFRKLFKQR